MAGERHMQELEGLDDLELLKEGDCIRMTFVHPKEGYSEEIKVVCNIIRRGLCEFIMPHQLFPERIRSFTSKRDNIDFDRNDKTLILHGGSTGVQDYKPTDLRYEKLKEILNYNNQFYKNAKGI